MATLGFPTTNIKSYGCGGKILDSGEHQDKWQMDRYGKAAEVFKFFYVLLR